MTPSQLAPVRRRARRPLAVPSVVLALVVSSAAAPVSSAPVPSASAPAEAGEKYGEGVDVAEPTPIAAIVADPDAWIGKTVRVEGRVADVCPMKGCWMELAEEESGQVVRVRVDDGVIVFPSDATGRAAVAQGKVTAIEMSREDYVGWLAHLAEERGETFDEEAAGLGDGPFRIIEIRATGAEIPAAEGAADAAGA